MWQTLPLLLGTLLMLDMHKLEVSGLQCCVCVPSSLFPAAADNSYWTRSARYGSLCVCVCLCLLMGIVVCLPVCCVCVSMECVVLCVCSSLSIYLCLFTYLQVLCFCTNDRTYQGQLISPRGDELLLFLTITSSSSSLPSGCGSSSA